ncbi:TPM domain-containing protein [bacterium]|nr:TPM domain-containing protein [bacterium]
MKKMLSEEDRGRLDGLVAGAEKRTGAEIVLAVTGRSDNYAELPWKAFALGASLAGLAAIAPDWLVPDWTPRVTAPLAALVILVTGTVFALLAVLIPAFAKRFLTADRADTEVRQYAESLFLNRGLFGTSRRNGVLLLVSRFERKVVILPDKGLADVLSETVLGSVIASMVPFLKRNDIHGAFETGLDHLCRILGTGEKGTGENELPDGIIEEKGV